MAKQKRRLVCKEFTFITDDRFRGTKSKLNLLSKKLKKSGIDIVQERNVRSLIFPPEVKGGKKSKQWRQTFVVNKRTNETWDDVFSKINKIQANPYKSVSCG